MKCPNCNTEVNPKDIKCNNCDESINTSIMDLGLFSLPLPPILIETWKKYGKLKKTYIFDIFNFFTPKHIHFVANLVWIGTYCFEKDSTVNKKM